ncbi:MAG: acyl-CoA desaturase [Bacteroidetes bacterium]|nr:acyl-CoA desaturase [Bacteroidota bacterium]
MKPVRFIGKDRTEFSATLRKNVNNYFRENNISVNGNRILFLKTAILSALYIIPFILILTIPMKGITALLLCAVIAIGMSGIGMSVMHDGGHGAYSDKKWVNKIMAKTMYILGGCVFNWNMQHNIMHHTFTNILGYDEDIEPRAVIRLSPHAPALKFQRFQHIYALFLYGMMSLSLVTKDFRQLWLYYKKGVLKQQNAEPVAEFLTLFTTKVLYLFTAIVLPVLLTDFSWWQVLIGFLLMHFISGVIMSTIFQMAHIVEGADHPLINVEGNIDNEWVIHQLYTTSNFARNNALLNWFIGGLNFQIEHHLFPNISHVHYPAIAPIVEKTAYEFGLPYNMKPTFFGALKSHLRTLKEFGERKAAAA